MDFGVFSSLVSVVLPQLLTKMSDSAASSAGEKMVDYVEENGLWKSIVRVFVVLDEEDEIKAIEQKEKLSSEDVKLINQTVLKGLKQKDNADLVKSVKSAIGVNEVNEFIVVEKMKVIMALREKIENLTEDVSMADILADDLGVQQNRAMRRIKREVDGLMRILEENRI